ncbi:MAG TPA: nicotinamide-nucleotide amidohydrolase family protein, partial [Micropepsaceae bacterium]|nr:nicotinamide-nucleotide amidohydrolase family protein [Micropepsaceae bacterium]
MFPEPILEFAKTLLNHAREAGLHLVTAESCTGGLIAGALTEIAGSSDVVERGFVVYSNRAKIELLGVPETLIDQHGAVSEEVARAMAEGALKHSAAQL